MDERNALDALEYFGGIEQTGPAAVGEIDLRQVAP